MCACLVQIQGPLFTTPYNFIISCSRYSFVEMLETTLLISTAELFLTLRVYALFGRSKCILFIAGTILLWQWGITFYVVSQASVLGTIQPAALLSRATIPHLPTLPEINLYHVCTYIAFPVVKPWSETYICLSIVFDGLAFVGIVCAVATGRRATHIVFPLTSIIQRDGILYFLVLFSSNLLWLLLAVYARVCTSSTSLYAITDITWSVALLKIHPQLAVCPLVH
ncbi:hypothetical protein FPV67DRAFT_1216163 [Lyophyllum atratum]|nr:hypothetical protein FPV67DRAFT_1216163 [Lyophyllum atratum]